MNNAERTIVRWFGYGISSGLFIGGISCMCFGMYNQSGYKVYGAGLGLLSGAGFGCLITWLKKRAR